MEVRESLFGTTIIQAQKGKVWYSVILTAT